MIDDCWGVAKSHSWTLAISTGKVKLFFLSVENFSQGKRVWYQLKLRMVSVGNSNFCQGKRVPFQLKMRDQRVQWKWHAFMHPRMCQSPEARPQKYKFHLLGKRCTLWWSSLRVMRTGQDHGGKPFAEFLLYVSLWNSSLHFCSTHLLGCVYPNHITMVCFAWTETEGCYYEIVRCIFETEDLSCWRKMKDAGLYN